VEKHFIINKITIQELNNLLANFKLTSFDIIPENNLLLLTLYLDKTIENIFIYENESVASGLFVQVPFFDAFFSTIINESKLLGAYSIASFLIKETVNGNLNLNQIPNYLINVDNADKQLLKIYFYNNFNTTKTSKTMYFHRNTVINKINTFFDKYNIDIKDVNNAFFVKLLLDIYG
jgi:hypothetical protein